MGSVFASKKASDWMRELIVSGLEGRPVQQARARNFGGGRVIATVIAIAGLLGIGAATVLLVRG
jgi:predicted ATP-dependent serine protease